MMEQILTYSRKEISRVVNLDMDKSINAVRWRATPTDPDFWNKKPDVKNAEVTLRSSVSTTMSIPVSDHKDSNGNTSTESGRIYPGDGDEVFVK